MTDGRTPCSGVLRIVAGCLFVMHGIEKYFGVGGGRIDRDIMTIRGLGRLARIIRWTAHHHRALHATGRVHPVWRDGSGLLQIVGAARLLAKLSLPGMEASILFCYLFLFLWAAGPGAWSLDGVASYARAGRTQKGASVEDSGHQRGPT